MLASLRRETVIATLLPRQKNQDYEQIASIFPDTADNEKEHAKRFLKLLEGGTAEITASFPAGVIGDTVANLNEGSQGENYECSEMYPQFAKIADEEGFAQIGEVFRHIARAEKQHEKRYRGLLKNVTEGKVFKKESSVAWRCRNCGYVHDGSEAPQECPACSHPRAYFELLAENW